ncbi:FtsX-like permease family protein [Salinibacter ruber]|jgi:putative ABC transport system permease protein|uniref:ABC transport system permease protein n=1 Tax=Salinibacter ruber TaxID=146919 RepID=A0A9X2UJU8_9BACT|nr:FtsX-like permease family protein [Salinibacter ruber]MCS3611535.1 putative ABC transport system permease protein [Salinibacter ruber]MCS3615026.1 putative ABC transport system permease protein [Salinibacter ruber]MCS3646708.1 putative ABC transport system permease protein [Salinibacter ruber]MCS3675356.1 putative ABC transport system permease protein [Salinibacter ruber]MCS3784459.1 putative ABC transport system permease protein [Salinibacter ruber]
MLRNYLIIALRSLRRHLGYTAINVVGLAVGIAACLLIGLYVQHQWSHDRFHEAADRIHRVVGDYGETTMPATQWPVIEALQHQNPSLTIAPFFTASAVVGPEERRFNEDQVFIARPSFFDVFTFPVRRGTARAAFDRPYTAVLTPTVAEKYFGETDPVGKTLEMTGLRGDETVSVTVTGLLEPIPDASHFHPGILVSWATLDAAMNFTEEMRENWSGGAFRAYLKVPEGTDHSRLADQFTRQAQERAAGRWDRDARLRLQPLTDIHLYSDLDFEIEANGSAETVYLFFGIALFILLLAGVNFVNLALARSVERTQEVGVRKAIGAGQGHIAWQFLVEALVLTGCAAVLALVLAATALPLFHTVTEATFEPSVFVEPRLLALLAGIALVTALGSASYPAFVLSRFDPATVLGSRSRGAGRTGRWSSPLRRGLVVFQFAVAVTLGTATVVAYWQLDYLQTADLGFETEQVVTVPMPPDAQGEGRTPFQQEVVRRPHVLAATQASPALPARLLRSTGFAFAGQGVPDDEYKNVQFVTVGPTFFEALGVEPVTGRSFDPGRPADSSGVVLNRAALDQLATDLPSGRRTAAAAVGRSLTSSSAWLVDRAPVVGVVDDLRLRTLHDAVAPTVFVRTSLLRDTYYLRVDATQADQALSEARAVWEEVHDAPFDYTFADQAFASAYRSEQRAGTLFGAFAGLALVLAGLGLFGLAAFTARQRQKEVAVRKAVGASMGQIVRLFSTDVARLVGVAIVIAAPVAYVGLQRWLNTFADHVDLGPLPFVLAGGSVLLVAVLSTGTQALQAARIDPATVLRNE